MDERTESAGHFEMQWDCDHCGAKGLLAKSQRNCGECGAPQNPDKRYFPEPGAEQRVDGHVYEGSDRHCPSCNAPMGAKARNCTKCGAPLDGAVEVRGVAAPLGAVQVTTQRSWRKPVIIALVIAAIVLAIYLLFVRTKSAKMVVTGHRWDSVIGVEVFGPVNDAEWRDRMPANARSVSCVRKERSSRRVDTGKETCTTENKDNKDGTFEKVTKCKPVFRSEPIDDDWCSYTVNRWTETEQLHAEGAGLMTAWPQTALPAQAAEAPGAQRTGRRVQKLILELGKRTCEVPQATWMKYQDGQNVTVEVRARSGEIVCSSL